VPSFAAGDRVANLLISSCGKCPACLRGETPFCTGPRQSFGQTRDGGYAELVAAPVNALVPVPAEVSDVEAASVACTFGVAMRALRTIGQMKPGERVLITGASGGVGMAAIQVAKALGVQVIAATTSESKRAALLEVGADDVVVDKGEELHRKVRAVAREGVDAALELTGSPTFTAALRSLRVGGRLILVGNIPTEPIRLNPGAVILNGLQIRGTAGCTRADLVDVFALLAAKKMHVVVHRTLPLAQAPDAHRILSERGAVGRIVLVP
jgi:D-arabinose 1-dehydrogenase-like Zn-dependent alcohol dehydrogenase